MSPSFRTLLPPPPPSTPFPYTTLFRSAPRPEEAAHLRQLEAAIGSSEVALANLQPQLARAQVLWETRICAEKPSSPRSEEHTSELQSLRHLVCRLLLEKKNKNT